MTNTTLMRIKQVESAVGLKKSSIYAKVKEHNFPVPVRLGPKSVAWKSSEVQEWIDTRPRANNQEAA